MVDGGSRIARRWGVMKSRTVCAKLGRGSGEFDESNPFKNCAASNSPRR
jgi:hypothetical protein